MKQSIRPMAVMSMAGILFLCMMVCLFPGRAQAGPTTVPVEGIGYNVSQSMADNLNPLIGKKVYIHLDSGEILSGFIKDIGPHLVHLEKLDQRNFFDALIQMDHIIAVDTQFRKN